MPPEDDLLATVKALVDAELHGDLATLERILAPDFVGFDQAGRMQDRQTILDAYRAGFVRIDGLTPSDLHVQLLGESGVVSGVTTIRGVAGGEPFSANLRFLDVFAYRSGGWQLLASQVTTMAASGLD
jgi:ketosteroid isomerase-like protein